MKRSHSNDLRDGLTPGQERAIRALLTARSVAAAARQANVGQSTLRRWLREDDNFETELHRYREEALCFASLILQRNLAWVVGLMYEFIKTDARSRTGRPPSSAPPSNTPSAPPSTATSSAAFGLWRESSAKTSPPPTIRRPRQPLRAPKTGPPPLTINPQPLPNKALHKTRGCGERIFADLLIPAPTPPSRMNRFFVNLLTTAQSGPRNPAWRTAPPGRLAPPARGPGNSFSPQHRNQHEWTRNMPSFARSASQECGQSA